ncbi:MAG: hypothetical protein RLZZ403_630 [Pseudomonadota bacterium]|jgi:hypothetical protein
MTRTFRKGDRVLVPGVVRDIEREGLIQVTVTEGAEFGWKGVAHVAVDPNTLVMKEPGPPQVGDEVIALGDESMTWTVIAFDGEWAWIKATNQVMQGRGYASIRLADLNVVRAC